MLTPAKPLSLKARLMLIAAAGVMTTLLVISKQGDPEPVSGPAWAAPEGYAEVAGQPLPGGGSVHLWAKPLSDDHRACYLLEGRDTGGEHDSTAGGSCSEITEWGLDRGMGVLVIKVPHRAAATVALDGGADVPVHSQLALVKDAQPEERPLRLTAVAKDAGGKPLGGPGEIFSG